MVQQQQRGAGSAHNLGPLWVSGERRRGHGEQGGAEARRATRDRTREARPGNESVVEAFDALARRTGA